MRPAGCQCTSARGAVGDEIRSAITSIHFVASCLVPNFISYVIMGCLPEMQQRYPGFSLSGSGQTANGANNIRFFRDANILHQKKEAQSQEVRSGAGRPVVVQTSPAELYRCTVNCNRVSQRSALASGHCAERYQVRRRDLSLLISILTSDRSGSG